MITGCGIAGFTNSGVLCFKNARVIAVYGASSCNDQIRISRASSAAWGTNNRIKSRSRI
jgi:hypothetical protein